MEPFPNPSNALFAWNWEDIPGVPRRTGYRYSEFAGETLTDNALTVERTQITRAAMTQRALPGKIEAGGEIRYDVFNPAADWWLLASLFGHCVTTEPETDAFLHTFSRSQVAVDFLPTFTARVWRDDGMAESFPYSRISQLAFSAQERALAGVVATVATIAGDYWGDAVRTTGTGTGFMVVRGLLEEQFDADATDQNVGFKIISSTPTTVTFKAKLGDLATYDGADQTVPRGQWVRFADQGDVLLGDMAMPAQVYFPTTGTFVADDEYTVARRRGEWVPSFAQSIAVNEIYSTITVDDVEEEMESFNLTVAMPTEARFGIGGRRARRTRQRGQQTATGTLNREALSVAMRKRLSLGTPFDLRVYLRSAVPIGTTGALDFSLKLVMPFCVASGNTPTVEDKDTYNEQITFSAHPSDDPEYPDDVTAEVVNNEEDLLAA